MRLHLEMLLSGMAGNEEQRQSFLARILSQVERLSRLTTGALSFLSGQQRAPDDVVPRSPEATLELCRSIIRENAELFGLQLELDECVSQRAATVHLSEAVIRVVVENLLSNTARHGCNGEQTRVAVTLTLEADELGIVVRDFGSGVAGRELPGLFEPFVRGQQARSERRDGIGLGLAIVRRAVASANGTIGAEAGNPGLRIAVRLPTGAGDTPRE